MDGATPETRPLPSRIGVKRDLDSVTQTLWEAFRTDPVWSWAFPGGMRLDVLWRFLINSALRYPWVWIAGEYAAATVWIPPDGTELTEQEEERAGPLLDDLLGPRAPAVMELLERFGGSHPNDQPHFYLSLFGTRPDARGHGYGMALLRENLATIDEARMPAYLESTNPANDKRYESVGFVRAGEFSTPDGSRTVTTMWRDAR